MPRAAAKSGKVTSVFIDRLGERWVSFVTRELHATPRSIGEFVAVILSFALADPTASSLLIGLGISLVGEALRVTSAGYGYHLAEQTLRGPYRFVRHPYFLGSALLFLGVVFASRSTVAAVVGVLLLTLVYRLSYVQDERRLARQLGPEYGTYRANVPAFFPQLMPAPLALSARLDNHKFAFEYALLRGRHRELDACLGLLLAYALFYVCLTTQTVPILRLGSVIAVALYLASRFVYYRVYKRQR